jgi:tRNA(Ile)-lysidine synthase
MRESSSNEALKLSKILAKKKITHHILEIDAKKLPKKNIEAKLREMRYDLLCEFCKKKKISYLFLGHQLGDVAENFLIRLFRGSGLDGLSTIAEVSEVSKIKLVRPLLDFDKSDLEKFLRAKKIKWFEDETNSDEKFLRNKIRNFFATFEEKNLLHKRIKNATDEIAKMRELFDSLMLSEASEILEFKQDEYFLIDHKKLQKLDEKFALKILALVTMEVSGKKYKPRLKDLKIFYEYLLKNSKIKPRNFYGCEIMQYDEKFLIVRSQKVRGKFELQTILKKFF